MQIRYVCFDLGGVIVRICHSFIEAAQSANLPFLDDPRLRDAAAVARRRELILAHQVGTLTMSEYCAQMSEALDGLYQTDQVRSLHAAWLLGEYPGIDELLTELSAKTELTLACLSNTNDAHWEQMLGPEGASPSPGFRSLAHLHHKLASHLLRLAKPERAIYEAALTVFGCSPGEVLFFDDLIENIEAARESGWNAERIDPTGDTVAQMRRHLETHGVSL